MIFKDGITNTQID